MRTVDSITPIISNKVPDIIEALKSNDVKFAKMIGSATTPYFRMFNSDVDLVVEFGENTSFSKLSIDLYKILKNIPFDLLDTRYFPHMINEEGVVLINEGR